MLLLLAIGACTSSEEEIIGSIYGKVTDSKNGKVLQGVTITLIPGGLSRTTGSDGTYEFLDLEAKQYQVQAQKMGYVTDTKSVNVLVGQAASGDMRLTPEKKDAEAEKNHGRREWRVRHTHPPEAVAATPSPGASPPRAQPGLRWPGRRDPFG